VSERPPRRSRRFVRWLIAPVLALVASTTFAYNTNQGQSWLDQIARQGTSDSPTPQQPSAVSSSSPSVDASTSALADPPSPRAIAAPSPNGPVDADKVAAIWRQGLTSKAVGKHIVAAVTPLNGEVSASPTGFASGSGPVVPASTMKLLTSLAALEVLGPDHTFSTRAVLNPVARNADGAGTKPPGLVLVGGGDPLLARRPSKESSPQRADIRTLAKRTAQALSAQEIKRVRLTYDASLFAGPPGSEQWRADYLSDNIVAPITALWVDEGRPSAGYGRVDDPALAATTVFAAALRRAGIAIVGPARPATAQPQAAELAAVQSAPLAQIVEHTLAVSDNEAAEVLAHHVGVAVANEGSFEGGARGVATTLSGLGVPLTGAAIYDGSGLSRANRLTTETLLAVLQLASQAERPALRAVLSGLPVAGFTGSLAYRFADGPSAGGGNVRAKTGTLTGVHGLAGLATDVSGNTYAFVIIADKVPVPKALAARTTIDRLAARLAACNCGAN
jgi:serine-type D-Ala-D-Ala carboxypeptidase/endopeptidase (penicillin-binding protein 4)